MEPTTTTPNPATAEPAAAPAAAAPAAAAPAPVTAVPTGTPGPTLAQRYTYAQLDPAHKAIADQVTALIIAYPDILAMRDPEAQRKFLEEVKKKGVAAAARDGGAPTAGILTSLANSGVPGVADLANTFDGAARAGQTGGDVVGALAAGAGLVASPGVAAAAGFSEYWNQIKVNLNGMTPQQAQDLATAYASTLQARQADRMGAGWTAPFSGFRGDNFGQQVGNGVGTLAAYIGAAIAWVVDLVRGHVFNQDNVHTFEEHLARAFFKGDMNAVRTEMGRTPGLENGEAWSHVLTEGGTVQGRAGTDMTVDAPTVDNPVPTAPTAPANPDGTPVVEEANPAAAAADARRKGAAAAGAETQQSWDNFRQYANANTPLLGGVALAGGYGLVQVGRGALEGIARGPVKAKDARAKKAETRYNRAASRVTDLEEKLHLAQNPEENNKRLFRVKETPEQLQTQLDEAKAEADRLKGLATDARNAHRTADLRLSGGAMDAIGTEGFRSGLWHAPRNAGRGLTMGASGIVNDVVKGVVDNFRGIPERWAAGVARADAEIAERNAKRDENKIRRDLSRVEPGSDFPLETKYKEAKAETEASHTKTLEAKRGAKGLFSGLAHRIVKTFPKVSFFRGGAEAPEPARAAPTAPDAPRPAPDASAPAPEPQQARPAPEAETVRTEAAAKPKGPVASFLSRAQDFGGRLADNFTHRASAGAEAFRGVVAPAVRVEEGRGAARPVEAPHGVRGEGKAAAVVPILKWGAAGLAAIGAFVAAPTLAAASTPERPRAPVRPVAPTAPGFTNDELLAMQAAARPAARAAVSPRVRGSVVGGTVVLNENGNPIAGVPNSQQIRAALLA